MTPDGLSDNMRRLGLSPFDIELIVLSHGHSDHVTGLDGFVRAVGPSNLPLVVHPGADCGGLTAHALKSQHCQ